MSLCGPRAVARITGQPVADVVAFIRERRRRNGHGRALALRGGTDPRELRAALEAAGYYAEPTFDWHRIRFQRLATLGLTGPWLFFEGRHHFFAVRSGADLRRQAARKPRWMIVAGWQVTRWR